MKSAGLNGVTPEAFKATGNIVEDMYLTSSITLVMIQPVFKVGIKSNAFHYISHDTCKIQTSV